MWMHSSDKMYFYYTVLYKESSAAAEPWIVLSFLNHSQPQEPLSSVNAHKANSINALDCKDRAQAANWVFNQKCTPFGRSKCLQDGNQSQTLKQEKLNCRRHQHYYDQAPMKSEEKCRDTCCIRFRRIYKCFTFYKIHLNCHITSKSTFQSVIMKPCHNKSICSNPLLSSLSY